MSYNLEELSVRDKKLFIIGTMSEFSSQVTRLNEQYSKNKANYSEHALRLVNETMGFDTTVSTILNNYILDLIDDDGIIELADLCSEVVEKYGLDVNIYHNVSKDEKELSP
jgi:hypothetical protein